MNYYVTYKVRCLHGDQRDILIANLSNMGFEGFEERELALEAHALNGNIDQNSVDAWLTKATYEFEKVITPEQNWNALWESNFQQVIVGDFVSIRAHFHPPVQGVQYDIQITPKMSFGTGHHATTRQMVECMQLLPIKGSRVFDFGTGTGILAILAAKMGAASVEAIDNDKWSITNAAENILVNQVQHKIYLRKAENVNDVLPADIVLANINKHILMTFLPLLSKTLKQNGHLVLSGLLTTDAKEIEQAAKMTGLLKIKQTERDNWIAIIFIPQKSSVKLL